MKTFTFFALVAAGAGQASAICAGFNYGIGNQQNLGGGVSRCEYSIDGKDSSHSTGLTTGTVYDDGCKAVDSL